MYPIKAIVAIGTFLLPTAKKTKENTIERKITYNPLSTPRYKNIIKNNLTSPLGTRMNLFRMNIMPKNITKNRIISITEMGIVPIKQI